MPRKKRTPAVNPDAGLSPNLSPTDGAPCPRCGYPKAAAGLDCPRCEAPPVVIIEAPAMVPNSTVAILQRAGGRPTGGR